MTHARRQAVSWLLGGALCACLAAGCAVPAAVRAPARPDWVGAAPAPPEDQGAATAVGRAGPGADPQHVQRQADTDARAQLNREVEAYVRDTVDDFLQDRGEFADADSALSHEFANLLASEVSLGILRHAESAAAWTSPDGVVYVLYRVPTLVIHTEMERRLPYALGQVNPFGPLADGVPARFRTFLDARATVPAPPADEGPPGMATAAGMEPRPGDEARPPTTPDWLAIGPHKDYPVQEFLTAIGLGSSLPAAEESAREKMAFHLNDRLAELMVELGSGEPETPLAENVRWLDPETTALPPGRIVGMRIAERWRDPDTESDYALAVLDRETAAVAMRRAVGSAVKAADALHGTARNHEKAGNYARSLADYLEATGEARRAVVLQLTGMAIRPRRRSRQWELLVDRPVLADVKADLRGLLAQMKAEKVGGDMQWMPPGVPPAQPLRLRLAAGEEARPVAGAPFRLMLAPGAALPATTNEEGMAEWALKRPLPTGSAGVAAQLDLAALSPGVDDFRLSPPEVTFEYVLRSRENTRLALFLEESPAGARPITEALRRSLREEGFQLVDEAELLKHVGAVPPVAEADPGEVLAAFAELEQALGPGEFLLVLAGRAGPQPAEKVETGEGDLYFVQCPYLVRVLDGSLPEGHRTVLTVEGKGKGAYLDDEVEARSRARSEAAAEAGARLVEGLRGKLAAEGP